MPVVCSIATGVFALALVIPTLVTAIDIAVTNGDAAGQDLNAKYAAGVTADTFNDETESNAIGIGVGALAAKLDEGTIRVVDSDDTVVSGVTVKAAEQGATSIGIKVKRSVFSGMADAATLTLHLQWLKSDGTWNNVENSSFKIHKTTTFAVAAAGENVSKAEYKPTISSNTGVLTFKRTVMGTAADAGATGTIEITLDSPLKVDPSLLQIAWKENAQATYEYLGNTPNGGAEIKLDTTDDSGKKLLVTFVKGTGGLANAAEAKSSEGVYSLYLTGNIGTENWVEVGGKPIKFTVEEAEPLFQDVPANADALKKGAINSFDVKKNTPVSKFEVKQIGSTDNYGLFWTKGDGVDSNGKFKPDATYADKLVAYVPKTALPMIEAKSNTEEEVLKAGNETKYAAADYKTAIMNTFGAWLDNYTAVNLGKDSSTDEYKAAKAVETALATWSSKILETGDGKGIASVKTAVANDAGGTIAAAELAAKKAWVASSEGRAMFNLADATGKHGLANGNDDPTEYARLNAIIGEGEPDATWATQVGNRWSNITEISLYSDKIDAHDVSSDASVVLAKNTVIKNALKAADYSDVSKILGSDATFKGIIENKQKQLLALPAHGGVEADVDWANITWLISSTNAKGQQVKSSAMKICDETGKLLTKEADYKGTASTYDASGVRTDGSAVIYVSAEGANKKFNGNATVWVGSAKKADKLKITKGNVNGVLSSVKLFTKPEASSEFKAVTNVSKTGISFGAAANNAADVPTYTLKLDIGKSFKLPFAAKNGAEKDLAYEIIGGASKGFSLNGAKVTAYAANDVDIANTNGFKSGDVDGYNAGKDIIKVYSRRNPELCAYVLVEVDAKVKSLRANTKSVGIWLGGVQEVSLGTNPSTNNDTFNYKVECDDYDICSDSTGTVAENGIITGNVFYIKPKSTVTKYEELKKSTVKATLLDNTGAAVSTVRELKIAVTPVTAPQDIKSVKATYKKAEINIPEGGAFNTGFTVAPAAALNKYNDLITANAGEITGEDAPTIASENSKSDTFKGVTGYHYNVNTYKPAGSIDIDPASDYTVKGGFLMTKDAAATDCDYTFTAGKTLNLGATGIKGGDEDVIWTCNKFAAVRGYKATQSFDLNNDGDTADTDEDAVSGTFLDLNAAGTYTVTGTTKYTKQKFSFKVKVEAASGASTKNLAKKTKVYVNGRLVPDKGEVDINVKDKVNAYIFSDTEGIGAVPTFSTADKTIATIDKNGVITGKSAGKTTITVAANGVTRTFDVVVDVDVTVNKSSIPAGGIKGKEVKLSASFKNYNKKTMKVVWEYRKSQDEITAELTDAEANFANKEAYDGGTADKKALFDKYYTWVATVGDGTVNYSAVPKYNAISALDNKLSGKWTLPDAGVYKVKATVTNGEKPLGEATVGGNKVTVTNDKYDTYSGPAEGSIKVYENEVKAANVNNGDADTKKAIAALAGKVKEGDDKTKFNGTLSGYVYVPVFVTPKDDKKPVAAAVAGADGDATDDIVWTSSNKSLAKVVDFTPKASVDQNFIDTNLKNKEENDIAKNATADNCYGVAKIKVADGDTPDNKYTGIVTIKGILKNSGKVVSVKLNVKTGETVRNNADNLATPYNPQTVTLDGSADNSVTLSNILKADKANETSAPLVAAVADGSESYKKLQDIAKAKKIKSGKTLTTWQYVLVNSTNVKDVNNADKKDAVAVIPSEITVNNETGAVTLKATSSSNTVYLALAQVTYTVDKAYAEEVKNADGTTKTAEQLATFKLGANDVKVKVTAIASKTPMVQS